MSASIYDPTTKTLVPFAGTSISMMSELSDVELSAPSNGQVLMYDSTSQAWENADNVSDVSVTPVLSSGTKIATVTVDGSSTDLYAPSGGGGGGASSVSDLTDVELDNVQNGQVLKWNSTDEVWENANESGGGGGHTIEDSEGTELTQRDTLQFGEGFIADDDSTNEKTVITPDVMQSGDMSDVITPLPSVGNKLPVLFDESGAERVIGWYKYANGTKKPVYQKAIVIDDLTLDAETKVAHNIANVEFIANVFGVAFTTAGQSIPIPFYNKTTAYNIFVIADKTYISAYNYGLSNRKAYITIQYTKTTS